MNSKSANITKQIKLLMIYLNHFFLRSNRLRRVSRKVFNYVNELHYKSNKISLNHKSKNNNDNCFLYAITVTLNNKKSKNNPERKLKFKLFINNYTYFPTKSKNWKMFETNNKTPFTNVLLLLLLLSNIIEKIRQA